MATIQDPGKFEGEPEYVRDLWDLVLDGAEDAGFDDGDTPVSVFHIDAELIGGSRGDLTGDDTGKHVLVWESDQGFVNSRVVDDAELARIEAACAADEAAEG